MCIKINLLILINFFLLFNLSCDSDIGTRQSPHNIYRAKICTHLVECSPIRPGGAWDWRTFDSCMETVGIPLIREVECTEAVHSLTCIGPGETPELTEQHVRDVRNIQNLCRPKQEGTNSGGGYTICYRCK